MAFPTLVPTSRNFDTGDYPVKTFMAQSGVEVRILYGSKRVGMKMSLSYDNVADTAADDFISHFDETIGTFLTFTLPSQVTRGWSGLAKAMTGSGSGIKWKYAEAPLITSVRPGISSVQVKLTGVV